MQAGTADFRANVQSEYWRSLTLSHGQKQYRNQQQIDLMTENLACEILRRSFRLFLLTFPACHMQSKGSDFKFVLPVGYEDLT